MKVSDYMKDRIGILLVNCAGIYALSLFLLMLGDQRAAVLLIDFAWLLVLACVLCIDFFQRKQYFDNLERILDQLDRPYLFSELAPVGRHVEDQIYHELLRRSNKSVIEVLRDKEQQQEDYRAFVEGWVHEIKTPITSAMLVCENMEQPSVSLKVALKRIENQVDMVLYYARMENANKDYLIHPCDLRKIVSAAIQMNRVYLRQQQAQIVVDMEETVVSTDEKWIEFILTQFMTNAVKYRSEQPLSLRFWCEERKEQVVLFIEDHGIGIAAQELGRVFEKGYTGTNGRTTHQSTGMGLYLCKRLCDKLGIGIRCESEPGQYTRMFLIFPNSSYYEGMEAQSLQK